MDEPRTLPDFGREFEPSRPLKSFCETVKEAAFRPSSFYSRIPRVGDYFAPLTFAVACGVLAAVLSGLYHDLWLSFEPRYYVLSVVLSPLRTALRCFLLAGITHPFVRITRGLGNAGFEATFRVFCYASVVALIDWTWTSGPGLLLGALASLYLTIVGLRRVHQTPTGTATFLAVFPVLPALFVTGVVAGLLTQLGDENLANGADRWLTIIFGSGY